MDVKGLKSFHEQLEVKMNLSLLQSLTHSPLYTAINKGENNYAISFGIIKILHVFNW